MTTTTVMSMADLVAWVRQHKAHGFKSSDANDDCSRMVFVCWCGAELVVRVVTHE